eukprot:4955264-Pyramimonas_sp.AAC.1
MSQRWEALKPHGWERMPVNFDLPNEDPLALADQDLMDIAEDIPPPLVNPMTGDDYSRSLQRDGRNQVHGRPLAADR